VGEGDDVGEWKFDVVGAAPPNFNYAVYTDVHEEYNAARLMLGVNLWQLRM
jgi:hypothetical protein